MKKLTFIFCILLFIILIYLFLNTDRNVEILNENTYKDIPIDENKDTYSEQKSNLWNEFFQTFDINICSSFNDEEESKLCIIYSKIYTQINNRDTFIVEPLSYEECSGLSYNHSSCIKFIDSFNISVNTVKEAYIKKDISLCNNLYTQKSVNDCILNYNNISKSVEIIYNIIDNGHTKDECNNFYTGGYLDKCINSINIINKEKRIFDSLEKEDIQLCDLVKDNISNIYCKILVGYKLENKN